MLQTLHFVFFLTFKLLPVISDQVKTEVPDTIYLPYSESEDVDFTIARKTGCYQWFVDISCVACD